MLNKHKRPKSAYQESCMLCKKDAYHKVSEEYIGDTVPTPFGYMCPMAAYICCGCFSKLMGVLCEPEET